MNEKGLVKIFVTKLKLSPWQQVLTGFILLIDLLFQFLGHEEYSCRDTKSIHIFINLSPRTSFSNGNLNKDH